jgi:hypothetical protein
MKKTIIPFKKNQYRVIRSEKKNKSIKKWENLWPRSFYQTWKNHKARTLKNQMSKDKIEKQNI